MSNKQTAKDSISISVDGVPFEEGTVTAQEFDQTVKPEVKKIPGFASGARYRQFTCDWLDPVEGADPLTVEMNVSMSLMDNERFGEILTNAPTLGDLWLWLKDRVRSWNAVALDHATGEYQQVRPPAEIGVDAFKFLDGIVTTWLAITLRLAQFPEKDRPKASSSTPDPASVSD